MWKGNKNRYGYGMLMIRRRRTVAHRIAWILTYGPIEEGVWVLHKCDVPSCARPDHLFLGDHLANMEDMVRKGRQPFGARNSHAKISEVVAMQIFEMHKSGITIREICDHLSVKYEIARNLVRGRTWKHLHHISMDRQLSQTEPATE